MNEVLPSYEAANARDYWSIIAQYIPSSDLCSAALVCREWHRIFTRQLWGNPASHFGVENDVVYVALVRFKRTLSWARLSTRELTHTLHFPPAHAEIYDGPHSDWLRDVLERLPRLQSLIVHGLPFFDHGALITLRRPSNLRLSSLSDSLPRMNHEFPLFWLRYLDASSCTNATYSGLAEALQHFPALLYLDLSKTKSAKGADVLSVLRYCHSLRVLKLRSLALKDAEIEALATAVKTRLKSLDVRDNQLTDASARILLDNCFNIKPKSWLDRPDGPSMSPGQLPPSPASPSFPVRDPLVFDQYDKEDLDEVLRAKLVGEFAGSTFINDVYTDGITHLYISDNNLTVEGVSGLLHSKKLHVLDVGTVARGLTKKPRPLSLLSFEEPEPQEEFAMPGAEKLTPVIRKYASARLTYLRVNHAVITEETSAADLRVGRAEMEGDLGIYAPASAHELDGFNEVHEAPTDSREVHELSTSELLPAELPAYENQVFELPGDLPHSPPLQPKVIVNPPEMPNTSRPNDPAITLASKTEALNLFSPSGTEGNDAPEPTSTLDAHTRPNRSSSLAAADRRARLEFRQSTSPHLHPSTLPKTSTLVLTDVPLTTTCPTIPARLTQFIADCAEETHIAALAARGAYALPPGRDRQLAEREYARSLFALRLIVLEMAPAPEAEDESGGQRRGPTTTWRQYPSKSSTEDADSEAFWSAAERDFSFFGDAEECGVPGLEPGRTLPLADMAEKVVWLPRGEEQGSLAMQQHQEQMKRPERVYDVVAELAAFRKDRKAAYMAALERGEAEPEVEGYWEGEIRVVRRPRWVEGESADGEVDCYGNYYEKGYNYR
ncbi:leucine rich repeat protein [Macrophomina phaseolina]|uniref:Leucine rich repeat protein n=1 Tax=Macrophomina phaseolina TaxID=35725 RepID=A0ABQ8GCG9_9PEZI|nr:leucine rich repeat protein [Macrophomina phaseolina]